MSKNTWIILSLLLMMSSVLAAISLVMFSADLEHQLADRDAKIAELQKRPDLPEFLNSPDIFNNGSLESIDFPGNYSIIWKPYSAKEIAEGRADHIPASYESLYHQRKIEQVGYLMYIKYSPLVLK